MGAGSEPSRPTTQRRLYDRWSSFVIALFIALFAWWQFNLLAALLVLPACVALGLWYSPLRPGRHVDHAAATASGRPVVYWKPGCLFCVKFRRELSRPARHEVAWVNIWRDDEAARTVARLNGGNEVTPTVVIDGRHVETDASSVEAALASSS